LICSSANAAISIAFIFSNEANLAAVASIRCDSSNAFCASKN
jgi:hypothetical protein